MADEHDHDHPPDEPKPEPTPEPQPEPARDDSWNIDPKVHRRLLRFLNEARQPDDLTALPSQRVIAFEDAGHPESAAHHHHTGPHLLSRAAAQQILQRRDQLFPLGLRNIGDAIAIDKNLGDLLGNLVAGFGPATFGRWDTLYPIEVNGNVFEIEHAALLRTGEVIFLADSLDTMLWDPTDEVNPKFTLLQSPGSGLTTNLVCCGHSFLSDGQLIAMGGGGLNPGAPTSNQAWRYNPITRKWKKTAGNMSILRWYPTVLTLGDENGPPGKSGRVMVAAGGSPPNIDVYSEATDTFTTVTMTGPSKNFSQTYPGLHLLPGGEIFYVPVGFANCGTATVGSTSDPQSSYFNFTPPGGTTGGWTNVGANLNRTKGMSALFLQQTYPFVQVVVAGGGDNASRQTLTSINLSTLSPSWGPNRSFPDNRPRANVNVVLLPDNTVFICGGLEIPPLTCWRYDPSTVVSPWSEMDETNSPRHYHSCAILLPSGKVMAAGGAANGGCTVSVQNTIEVFSPPYLFNPDGSLADRPKIEKINGGKPGGVGAPVVPHGSDFTIQTGNAGDIVSVVLVRPMAVTHQTDTEQRVIHCTFRKKDQWTLKAKAPNGSMPHALAPRGYYMLFILNDKGVPSVGQFVHLK